MEYECTQKELIEEKFKGVYLHQQAEFDLLNSKLDMIYEQAKKTNGRVTALEQYRWKMAGIVASITFIITFIISYLNLKK